jgi:cold shock CspA family protein
VHTTAPDDGQKNVFAHSTVLERAGLHGLREGRKVKFDAQNDPRKRQDRRRHDRTRLTKKTGSSPAEAPPATAGF